MATKTAILDAAALLHATVGFEFPDTEEKVTAMWRVWEKMFAGIPDDLLERATLAAVRKASRRYPLAPGAIYQEAVALTQAEKPLEGQAFEQAVAACRDGIARAELADEHAWDAYMALDIAIRRAAKQVGLREMADGENRAAVRSAFARYYAAQVEVFASERLAATPCLAGGRMEALGVG